MADSKTNNQQRSSTARLMNDLGCRYPIIQSPMGWIARAQLASAVCRAGAMGMIETSSGEVENCMKEIDAMREAGIERFAVNLSLLLLRDERMFQGIVERAPKFVTTSAGSPALLLPKLKEAGITVYHSIATLATAAKAIDAGVDGLIVEGHEGGGFKNPAGVSGLILVRAIRSQWPDIPIVYAGGIADGYGMAAILVAGADGVQMGTRFVASKESPVHDNYKNAIKDSGCDDTLVVNRAGRPHMRVLVTEFSKELGDGPLDNQTLGKVKQLYFEGALDISVALAGQSSALINNCPPVADIVQTIIKQAHEALGQAAHIALPPSE